MKLDLIVIGGGPAGLMAAAAAAGMGAGVLLIDRNRVLGKKLRITGKGRCNVTNNCTVQQAVDSCVHGGKFLYGAFSAFTPGDVMSFFEGLGVPLKTERGNRVFPVSDDANDIAEALIRYAKDSGVTVKEDRVLDIIIENGAVWGVRCKDGDYLAPRVVIACGGASYPGTGSSGDGYTLARKAGHTVSEIKPSLVPLVVNGSMCLRLSGLSLRNCALRVTAKGEKRPVYTGFGELLFTHFGLSGPLTLSASAHLQPMKPGLYTFHIDLKPALDEKKLDQRILRDLEKNDKRFIINSLDELLPQKLIPVVVERAGIAPETRCNSLMRVQRQRLAGLLKDFSVEIEGFRSVSEAIVTSGGVSLKEIDPRTMESKLLPGLYFAGEVIDADAYTGGFNLQIAFSTGRLAGRSAARESRASGR